MTNNNPDSKDRLDYFMAELSKLSCKIGVQVGDNSRTNLLTVHDNLEGEYTLENSHSFGFKHSKGV